MSKLHIHSRKSWGARAPKPRAKQSPRNVRELFIHWPGEVPRSWGNVNTVAEERATMRSIQDFHMGPERGWSDFAYSFAVFQSGRVYRGRGNNYVPAGQLNHNTNTVAVVCFIGPDDKPSAELKAALKRLVADQEHKAGHSLSVRPHGAVTATECPGPRLRAILPELN